MFTHQSNMNLKLNNYKSLTDQSFDFSNINILIGENSSGKSSLLKFLLLLKQSLMGYKNRSSFNLALKGEFFDFGNFKDIISFNQTSDKLIFEFEFKDYHEFYVDFLNNFLESVIKNHPQTSLDFINLSIGYPVKIKIEIDSNIKNHSGSIITIYNKYLGQITLKSFTKDSNTFKSDYCQIEYENFKKSIVYPLVEFERDSFLKYVKAESLQEAIKEQNNLEDKKDIIEEFLPLSFLLIAQNYLETFLGNIEYVNPIYSHPQRFYMLEDIGEDTSNADLDMLVNILNDEERYSDGVRNLLVSKLNEALNFLGIADEIKFDIAPNMPVVELKVKIKEFWSNITDVGYGLSLQLPVIFQTIISSFNNEKNILFIEQPEVHLHPQLQARFIETIIKFGGNNIFYIETHSEHIIRKLQSLVKSKSYDLKASDVSIHYFKREKQGSIISKHDILENGKLSKNFPSGFFDTSYLLAKELL